MGVCWLALLCPNCCSTQSAYFRRPGSGYCVTDANRKISVLFGPICVIKAAQPRWISANWFNGNVKLEWDAVELSAV